MVIRRWIRRSILPVSIVILGLGFSVIPLMRGKFFFAMDNAVQNYPQTAFLHDALRHHVIPHWWFEIGFGAPVIAEGQAAHYDPLRVVLAALFSAPAALMLEIGFCLALSGLGVYFFLRELRLLPLACFAGAVGFMFSGHCLIYVGIMALLRASCFLPWIVWLAERHSIRRCGIDLLWTSLLFGLQFLSGNPTYAVITVVCGSLYLLVRNLQNPSSRNLRPLTVSLAGLISALGTPSAQVPVAWTAKVH